MVIDLPQTDTDSLPLAPPAALRPLTRASRRSRWDVSAGRSLQVTSGHVGMSWPDPLRVPGTGPACRQYPLAGGGGSRPRCQDRAAETVAGVCGGPGISPCSEAAARDSLMGGGCFGLGRELPWEGRCRARRSARGRLSARAVKGLLVAPAQAAAAGGVARAFTH